MLCLCWHVSRFDHLLVSSPLFRLTFLVARWAAGHRSMRTVTNYFLLNLSIADLLMSSLNCVFNFIFMLNSDWPFGSIYCTINNFVANVTVSTSVFTLVAISFDRWDYFVWVPAATRLNLSASKFTYIYIYTFLQIHSHCTSAEASHVTPQGALYPGAHLGSQLCSLRTVSALLQHHDKAVSKLPE